MNKVEDAKYKHNNQQPDYQALHAVLLGIGTRGADLAAHVAPDGRSGHVALLVLLGLHFVLNNALALVNLVLYGIVVTGLVAERSVLWKLEKSKNH